MTLTLQLTISDKETGAVKDVLHRDTYFPCLGPKTVNRILAPKVARLTSQYPGCVVTVQFPRMAD